MEKLFSCERLFSYERVFSYIDAHWGRHLNQLKEFLKIPSISSQSEHKGDIQECAQWVAEHLNVIGMRNVQVFETQGHPIVYGEWMDMPSAPTLLFYGHYDVQPPDPIGLWTSPPFEATIRDGNIYARGANDDKGQVFVHLKAIEAYIKTYSAMPVNIRIVLEGEEEIGSPHIEDFLREKKGGLKADFAFISDSAMYQKGIPSICYGLRGLAYAEIEVKGPDRDLHSGRFGGAVHNPVQALCEMIARLHDKDGCITIPGFYDDVLPISGSEREAFSKLPHNDALYAKELGVPMLYGERGFTTIERLWTRPTLECNGIVGGYTGEGAKTVLPSSAHAKISIRLVPDQRSAKISSLFLDHIKAIAPQSVSVKVKMLAGGEPVLIPTDSPAIKAAEAAIEKGFGRRPVFQRNGISIPVVAYLKEILGLDTVLAGFSLPHENPHAPDEHINLDNLVSGIRTMLYFYREMPQYWKANY